jgi:hypothetical protein
MQQLPVFEEYAAKTADHAELADYHRNYSGWAKEMAYLSSRASTSNNAASA